MRKDTSFSDRKLTEQEFSEKYWLNGDAPYQYHTGSIEDGRDEREQFVFNNIRALFELFKDEDKRLTGYIESLYAARRKDKKRMVALTAISATVAVIIIFLLGYELACHIKNFL
jgi:hypothetical protein